MSSANNTSLTPILDGLGLAHNEFEQLRSNGFVSREMRAHGPVYRLRFRVNRQQRVRGLGSDPEHAAAVQRELDELQRVRRYRLQARRLAQQANELVRQMKAELAPHVLASGYSFHGRAIRKSRALTAAAAQVPPNVS